ncbi:MAG: hypothetical protein ACP5N1_03245 [Candidatus Woesearchaeota archaeon]
MPDDYDEYEKQVEKEIEGLRYVSNKIIQAYRMRMELFIQRYNLLMSIDKNFDVISINPNFYAALDNILKKEEAILKIIKGDETKVGNNILYALEQLKKYNDSLGRRYGFNDKILEKGTKRLSGEDVSNFLQKMILFLEEMKKDLDGIEKRMEIEEEFIKKQTFEQFNNFILAWEDELKANDRMMKRFQSTLNSSQKIIRQWETEGYELLTGGPVGGFFSLMAGAGGFLTPALAVLGGAVGVSMLMIGLVVYFGSLSKEGLQLVSKEQDMISNFKKKRIIDKNADYEKKKKLERPSFLRRFFG